jgi:hypothetical protein
VGVDDAGEPQSSAPVVDLHGLVDGDVGRDAGEAPAGHTEVEAVDAGLARSDDTDVLDDEVERTLGHARDSAATWRRGR